MKKWAALLAICLLASVCKGQSVASLRGHIVDASGGAVAGANIKLTLKSTGAIREATSDAGGSYEFLQLQPGSYTLEVSASGFQSKREENLALLVATSTTEDITLGVASVQQEVLVNSVSGVEINTSDATLGNAFNEKQISSLPIEGRNVVELLSLQPGVTFLGNVGNGDDDSRSGVVNGARSDQSNVTLDGVDVNNQGSGYAFTSVLRMTQDSVEEFRVTTSNPNADAGRGSGAQITLITKSGSNSFHGSAYEYNRNRLFAANDYFLKQTQLENGEPNQAAQLIRNVFGGAVGGPIKKDKLFFFLNYEGKRSAESSTITRLVPSAAMRDGVVQYQCQPDGDGNTPNCPGGTVQGLSGQSYNVPTGYYGLGQSQLLAMDPQSIGVNQSMVQVLQSYPQPNTFINAGDGVNTLLYRFPAKLDSSENTYIARFDWNISKNHMLFARGNLMGDNSPGAPQFPGQSAGSSLLDNSRGYAIGYTAILRPNLVNNLRYGLTRQSGALAGNSDQTAVNIAGLDSPQAFNRSLTFHVPVHNITEDLAWTKGAHSFSFGTNLRFITDARTSTFNSFPSATINTGWLAPATGLANKGGYFDPPNNDFPAVSDGFAHSYDEAAMDLIGIVDEGDAIYNYDRTGSPLNLGTPVERDYRWNEYEFYGQDTWRIRKNLTLTLGLKYGYLQVPTEIHGTQVSPCIANGSTCTPFALSDFLAQSAQEGNTGGAANNVPTVSFDLSGRSNGKPDFWTPGKKDFSPRVSLAWSPGFSTGLLGAVFGGPGKSSFRAGYGLIYDHFGAAIVDTFDTTGSFGLSTNISNPPESYDAATSPRFTGITSIPEGLLPAAPAGGFPATPDSEGFQISWGIDSKVKTPYSHLIDFSFSRELSPNTQLEIAYVGRLAHRLLSQQDVAMPLNLTVGGTTYFQAAAALSQLARNGTSPLNVQNSAYWQALFPALNGVDTGCTDADGNSLGPLTATQNVYCQFAANLYNETYALYNLDASDSLTGAGLNTGDHTYPSYRFYHSQYSALYAWRSLGRSYYNAMEITLKHRFRGGLQADFNYTYSKSIDWTSQAERLGNSGGNNNAQIINTWFPDQLKGVSDFDMTHQINANYLLNLPFGRGRHFLGNANRVVDALIGGWELTGIVRWTSGLPYGVDDGSTWPTNWDIEGFATLNGPIPPGVVKKGQGPNAFADPTAVYNLFRYALPGESGTRNPLRGDGFYSWDTGLDKAFRVTETSRLQFRWEVFNVTNSVRFDPHSINVRLDNQNSFGQANGLLVPARVMQIALRFEF